MKLIDFVRETNLDNSLLIGYYGGGNYGDELLMEVLGNMLSRQGAQGVTVTYQQPETYQTMHHDFGFQVIDMHDRKAVFSSALTSKNILIGGGGLWGVDMNLNTFLLSFFLFISRWLLGKKIYLLGVGYYHSTTKLGRAAAWLAGKAANVIFARDDESFANFGRITKRVYQDADIAWNIPHLDLSSYHQEAELMQKDLPVGGKTLMVALRRPQAKRQSSDFVRYNKMINDLMDSNPNRPMLLVMLESERKDPELYKEARSWRRKHKHLRIIEAPYNPLTLFLYVRQNYKRLGLIAPQLHLLLTAYLNHVPFLPISYDNKVSQMFDQIGVAPQARYALAEVNGDDMQQFANDFFGGRA